MSKSRSSSQQHITERTKNVPGHFDSAIDSIIDSIFGLFDSPEETMKSDSMGTTTDSRKKGTTMTNSETSPLLKEQTVSNRLSMSTEKQDFLKEFADLFAHLHGEHEVTRSQLSQEFSKTRKSFKANLAYSLQRRLTALHFIAWGTWICALALGALVILQLAR